MLLPLLLCCLVLLLLVGAIVSDEVIFADAADVATAAASCRE